MESDDFRPKLMTQKKVNDCTNQVFLPPMAPDRLTQAKDTFNPVLTLYN